MDNRYQLPSAAENGRCAPKKTRRSGKSGNPGRTTSFNGEATLKDYVEYLQHERRPVPCSVDSYRYAISGCLKHLKITGLTPRSAKKPDFSVYLDGKRSQGYSSSVIFQTLVPEINRVLKGQSNYYRSGNVAKKFSQVEKYTRLHVVSFI